MKNFNDKMTAAIYLPSRDLVVVFTNKAFDVEDAECSWFHEQTHAVWHKSFTEEERERYGSAVLDYLKDKDFGLYNHIIDKYDIEKYKNEACSYLIEKVVREYGSDRFMSADFFGLEEIVKFTGVIQNYSKNGKRKEKKMVINLDELKPIEKPYKMYATIQTKEEKAKKAKSSGK